MGEGIPGGGAARRGGGVPPDAGTGGTFDEPQEAAEGKEAPNRLERWAGPDPIGSCKPR